MFGEMPIECEYDTPNCLSGGGGYILGPRDVLQSPNDKRYGFDIPPKMQTIGIGYQPNIVDTNNLNTLNLNTVTPSATVMPGTSAVSPTHVNPFIILGVIGGIIYLITK